MALPDRGELVFIAHACEERESLPERDGPRSDVALAIELLTGSFDSDPEGALARAGAALMREYSFVKGGSPEHSGSEE